MTSSALNIVNKSEKQVGEKSAEKNGEETNLEDDERQGGNDMNKKSDEGDDGKSVGDDDDDEDEEDESLLEELGDFDILDLANLGTGAGLLFNRWSSEVEKLVKRNTRLVYKLHKMIGEGKNNSMHREPSVKGSDGATSGKQGKAMSGALGKRVKNMVGDKDVFPFEGDGGDEEDDESGDVKEAEKEEYPTECGKDEAASPIPDGEEEEKKMTDEGVAKERMYDEDQAKTATQETPPVKKNMKPGQRGAKAMGLVQKNTPLMLPKGSDEPNSRKRDQLNFSGMFDGGEDINEQEEMMNDEEGEKEKEEEEENKQGIEKMAPENYDFLSKNTKARKQRPKKKNGKEKEMRLVTENDPLSLLKRSDVAGTFDGDEGANEEVEEDYSQGDQEEKEMHNYESLISVYQKSDVPQNIRPGRKQQPRTSSALDTVSFLGLGEQGMATLNESGDDSHGQVTFMSSIVGNDGHKTGKNVYNNPRTGLKSNITSKRGADVARHEQDVDVHVAAEDEHDVDETMKAAGAGDKTKDATNEDVEKAVDDTGMTGFADPGEGEGDDESMKMESGDVEGEKEENLTEAKNVVVGRPAPLEQVDEGNLDEYNNTLKRNKRAGKHDPKIRAQGKSSDISVVGALAKMGVDDYKLSEKGNEEEVDEDEAKLNLAAALQVTPAVDHVSLAKKNMKPGEKAFSGMFDEKNPSKNRIGQGEQSKEVMGGALVNKLVDNKNMIRSMAEETQAGNEESCDQVEKLNDEEDEETGHGMGEMPFDSLSALAKNIKDGKQQHPQERCTKTGKSGRKHAKDGRASSIDYKKGAAQPQCEDQIGDKLQPPDIEGDAAKDEQDVGVDAAAEYDTTEAAADDDDGGAGQCGTTTEEDSIYSV